MVDVESWGGMPPAFTGYPKRTAPPLGSARDIYMIIGTLGPLEDQLLNEYTSDGSPIILSPCFLSYAQNDGESFYKISISSGAFPSFEHRHPSFITLTPVRSKGC